MLRWVSRPSTRITVLSTLLHRVLAGHESVAPKIVSYTCTRSLASSPGSTFISAACAKEGEPGIQNHVSGIGPYTRVGRVADRENCPQVSYILKRSSSTWVKDLTSNAFGECSAIVWGPTERCFKTQTMPTGLKSLVIGHAFPIASCQSVMQCLARGFGYQAPSHLFLASQKSWEGAWGQGYS